MSDIKPIILHGHTRSTNPWKVVMILEELGLPYEHRFVPMADVKKEAYTKLNPNGRLPTIEDPNTGLTLWESGAIVEYLIDQYDKENKISFDSFEEKYLAKQYLHFQMSGQGPYYGQAFWFRIFHPEKIESAINRYDEQLFRVVEVLDNILKDKEYLVGNKCSYADIAFVVWEQAAHKMHPDSKRLEDFPNYTAWYERLQARPAIQKANALQKEAEATGKH